MQNIEQLWAISFYPAMGQGQFLFLNTSQSGWLHREQQLFRELKRFFILGLLIHNEVQTLL